MYYYYDTRDIDIEAGEERLVNYSEFEKRSQFGWVEFVVGAIIQDKSEERSIVMQQFMYR
jgi:hypothetical protein